jgi:putative peptidoglycan lipid II flippase
MNKKLLSTVAGASIIITITGILSKGLGFIREIILASLFGLSNEFDIYLIGAVLPITINTILMFLAQNYLIPAYNKMKENNFPLVNNFVQINLIVFLLGGIILALLLFLFSEVIINLYIQNSPHSTELALAVFRLFLISIPVTCIIAVLSAYLQIQFEFRYPAYSQLLLNIVFIILLLVLPGSLNIFIIPVGYLVGSFIQMLFLFKVSNLNIKFPQYNFLMNEFRKFIPKTLFIIILIESIGQLYLLVDRFFFSEVPTGGIAALNYALTLFTLPISILSIAVSTAVFPKFSQYASKNLLYDLERTFNEGVRINIAMFVPVTILFIFYGNYFVKIIFERGNFSQADTLLTYNALIFYSLSLIFYSVYGITNKILYSSGLIKNLLIITITGILLKIIMNYLFVKTLFQNGLALSSSITNIFFFTASFIMIYRQYNFKHKTVFVSEMAFFLINGFFSLLAVKYLSTLFLRNDLIMISEIIIFLIIFSVNIILIKHSSIQLLSPVINLLRRKGRFNE